MAWYPLRVDSLPGAPSARECNTIQVLDKSLVFFGGNDDRMRMNDTHIFDTESYRWQLCSVDLSSAPSPRSAHASAVLDGRYLLVFGGWDGNKEVGDLYSLDLDYIASAINHANAVTRKWSKVETTGKAPAARHFHTMVVIDRRLYVFGGFDGTKWRNDVSALDVDTLEWQHITPESCTDGVVFPESDAGSVLASRETEPGPRASACAAVIDRNKMLLFGGYDGQDFRNVWHCFTGPTQVYSTPTMNYFVQDMWILHTVDPTTGLLRYRWECVKPRVSSAGVLQVWPSPRSGHACEVFDKFLLIFGGRYRHGRFNDTYIFNTETHLWAKVIAIGDPFKARKTHAVGRVRSKVFLFGGHDGDRWLGDMHVFDIEPLLRSLVTPTRVPLPLSATSVPPASQHAAALHCSSSPHLPAQQAYTRFLAATKGIGVQADYVRVDGPTRHTRAILESLQSPTSGFPAVCPLLSNSVVDPADQLTSADLACPPSSASPNHLSFSRASSPLMFTAPSHSHAATKETADFFSLYCDTTTQIDLSVGNYHNSSSAPHNVELLSRTIAQQAERVKAAALQTAHSEICNAIKSRDTACTSSSSTQTAARQHSSESGVPDGELCDFSDKTPVLEVFEAMSEDGGWPDFAVTDDNRATCGLSGGVTLRGTPSGAVDCAPRSMYTLPGGFYDVAFRVEDKLVHMHRALLASRSVYFRCMFTSPLAESTAQVIPLEDVPLPVFLMIARHLYRNEKPTKQEMQMHGACLLTHAQHMQLMQLSLLCQRYFECELSTRNVLKTLCLADETGARLLKQACLRYIVNHYTAVSSTMEYVNLRADLLRQVLFAQLMARQTKNGKGVQLTTSPCNSSSKTSPPPLQLSAATRPEIGADVRSYSMHSHVSPVHVVGLLAPVGRPREIHRPESGGAGTPPWPSAFPPRVTHSNNTIITTTNAQISSPIALPQVIDAPQPLQTDTNSASSDDFHSAVHSSGLFQTHHNNSHRTNNQQKRSRARMSRHQADSIASLGSYFTPFDDFTADLIADHTDRPLKRLRSSPMPSDAELLLLEVVDEDDWPAETITPPSVVSPEHGNNDEEERKEAMSSQG